MEARIAYARLRLKLGGKRAPGKKTVTLSDVREDYLTYLQRRLKDGQLSKSYFKITAHGGRPFLHFVSPENPAKENTPSTLDRTSQVFWGVCLS